MSEAPQGYIPGVTTEQANGDKPFSRADDQFKSASNLREMIDTKRNLIRAIQQVLDDGYYQSQVQRLEQMYETYRFQWESLNERRTNGPAHIARLEADIVRLQSDLAATQSKQDILRLEQQIEQLAASGVDVTAMLAGLMQSQQGQA